MKDVLPLFALFTALTACTGKSADGARIERELAEAQEYAGYAVKNDALLSEGQRAQRWREEQTRWAATKATQVEQNAAEREKEIASVVAERPELLERLLELRRDRALAPPDKLPPALQLIQEENRVGLRNTSGWLLRVQASQLIANASGYPLDHCEFEIYDTEGRRIFGVDIAPDATVYLRQSSAWNCHRREGAMTLEVVIWRNDTLVWITETRVHDLLHLPPASVEEVLRRAEQGRRL